MSDEMQLELLVLPVADPDRSLAFYRDVMGWTVDVDVEPVPGMRVVQTTPPGSACSVTFGIGLTTVTPGTYEGMHLVVSDVPAVAERLVTAGADVGEVHHFGPEGRTVGPHPERADHGTFCPVTDPDGNTWVLQERGHAG